MAIITLAEVKAILQITDTSQDTLITTLIPIVERDFIKVRGIDFFIFDAGLTTGSDIIDILSNFHYKYFTREDKLETRDDDGAGIRGRVKYIDYDNAEVKLDSNSTVTNTEGELIVYPGYADYILSKMIDYMLVKDNATGYKSETFGSYNYTKFDTVSGYPLDITSKIEEYQVGYE